MLSLVGALLMASEKSICTSGTHIPKGLTVVAQAHGRRSARQAWKRLTKWVVRSFLMHRSFARLQSIIPDVMWGTAEFQGGAFDPWGGVSNP